ncbi:MULTISPECIES: hypothetical protein [unclassified Leptolyngbya]|uniref:hypothetical protein n=1 Tax=unclassified Leptolyngbya TaxID=2650499 RepID=UPI001681C970|nr:MULTISPECIES: hypothetical protein [unclassified Leptolyngbya]MBD1910662.1 hypothetical protein [Leptolyngbya sp. FACHB-8]MBD2158415.1 hypothetical protein [Leptolyngbya sp. FACHB-16]
MLPSQKPAPFQYVREGQNPFLALFPHRLDYIWAPQPQPGHAVEWQTESRHPLSDRLIEQGSFLYGVRFGKETSYALLDIDTGSPYHPKRDPFAIRRILEVLEPLGITHSLKLFSSYSGGIHIYLPLARAQKSGSLALAIAALVEHAGFKIAAGQLEIFPDPKPYIPKGKPQLYAAHRLPLQIGSYLLTEGWEPIYSPQGEFVRQWQFCAQQNEVTETNIKRVLKIYRRRQYRVSTNAAKFLNDLHAEIEQGWTGHGQTNHLLGRIAMREYIFGHILAGGAPLEGSDLVQQIVKVATALPGYQDWCRHQHEIHKRAEEWARCVETSRYFHYGLKSSTVSTLQPTSEPQEKKLSWNEQQAQTAREKIRQAIAQLLASKTLPVGTTERFKALVQHKISGSTLYRHRDLWHPAHLQEAVTEAVENPPLPPQLDSGWAQSLEDYARTARNLLQTDGCNTLQEKDFGDRPPDELAPGCNTSDPPMTIIEMVQETATQEAIENHKRIRLEGQQQQHRDRMRRYLESGDPILIAEALAWIQINGIP